MSQIYLRPPRGFTLLEMLVVMLLIGLMVSMITLVPTGSSSQQARREAERFTSLIDLLRQQAVERNQVYGVQIGAQRYAVQQLDGNGNWQTADGFRQQILAGTLSWRLERAAADNQPAAATTVAPRANGPQPDLLILPSDETTAFTLWLDKDSTALLKLSTDGLSEVQIESAR